MALLTLGTNAATSLSALKFLRGQMNVADTATFNKNILNDQVNGNPIWPGGFRNGVLSIPNRQGYIALLPGDYIAYDSTGWPIVLSANAIANGPWTHS